MEGFVQGLSKTDVQGLSPLFGGGGAGGGCRRNTHCLSALVLWVLSQEPPLETPHPALGVTKVNV